MGHKQVWIIDFGSQYTQLITRKTRELGHSSEIITFEEFKRRADKGKVPKVLVLSGGPRSISEDKNDYSVLFEDEKTPVLGICYGMQIMAKTFKGTVEKGTSGEYGHAEVLQESKDLINGVPEKINVWMSHFDHVSKVPNEFETKMKSHNGYVAMIAHEKRPIVGLQFHPEVEHTEHGKEILKYFYEKVAKIESDWSGEQMLQEARELVEGVGDAQVLCAFSGGVDSLVAATLAQEILGDRLHCFFVDHGLLRPQDIHHIKLLQEKTDLNIQIVDVKKKFLEALKGVSDPEKKRKIIGHTFIEVFEEKINEYEEGHQVNFTYLLQGTLYPDVIESTSPHGEEGASSTIKSHHNVGGLPERMKLKLVEPLRYLFKDEVRKLGAFLKLDYDWVHRHPFPGPGIGVRVLGELTEENIRKVQQSDQILFEELHTHHLYDAIWQALTVLLPVKTVGVKGDERAYEEVICVRLVNSSDGMTAEWSDVPKSFLGALSRRITNEVRGITRVVYDITAKPPGTIEWE